MRRYTNRCNVRSPIFDEIRHEFEVSRRSHRESVILRGPRQLVIWYEVNKTRVLGRYVFVDITQNDIYWQLLALAVAVFAIGWLIAPLAPRFCIAHHRRGRDGGQDIAGSTSQLPRSTLFAISAVFMTLVGAIMAPRWTYIEPSIAFNPTISFQVVIMALLGGAHRLWGPALGAIPLTLLFEFLSARFPATSTLIIGVVFLLIVYALPHGVTGLWERVSRQASSPAVWRRRCRHDAAPHAVLEVSGAGPRLRRPRRGQCRRP